MPGNLAGNGFVFSFSTFSLLLTLALAVGPVRIGTAETPTNAVERSRSWYEADARFFRATGTYIGQIANLAGLTDKQAEIVKKYYEVSKSGMTHRGMYEIYKAAGNDHLAFKLVAKLIADGKITQDHSLEMAKLRDQRIDSILIEIGQQKKWKIARSDSGNQTSGMKSDLDQTFYVFEWDDTSKSWKRNSKYDGTLCEEFMSRWKARDPPLSLASVDIASFEGKDRFPHPADLTVENFAKSYEQTIRQLRQAPGAYKTQGAVVQQMQMRALAEIMAGNPRAYRVYAPEEGGTTWKKWPPDNKHEWTEEQRKTWQEEAIRTMFGEEPELMKGFAFGASLANYYELQSYLGKEKFETKYHLRTWEDGMQVLWLIEQGRGKGDKREYHAMDPGARETMNNHFLEKMFPGNAAKQQLHKLALEISMNQRLIHKGEPPPDFENQKTRNRALFEKLGQAIGTVEGKTFNPSDPTHLKAVDAEYRKLASEFCLHSVYATATDAFEALVDKARSTEFVERYNKLREARGLKRIGAARTKLFLKRLATAARLTIIYGLYDLGPERAAPLLEKFRERYPNKEAVLNHLVESAEELRADPDAAVPNFHGDDAHPVEQHKLTYRELVSARWDELTERVTEHFLDGLRIENRNQCKAKYVIILTQNLVWNWSQYGRDRLSDISSLDSLGRILLTTVETKADGWAVAKASAKELFFTVPGAGMAVSIAEGDWTGASMMGLAIRFPVAGHFMLAYSIGSTGYEIYELEIARPQTTNFEDGLYRGFIGPELRDYGDTPSQFTPAEQAQLDDLEGRLRAVQAQYGRTLAWQGPKTFDVPYSPEAIERGRVEAELDRVTREAMPMILFLQRKKDAWEAYQKDRTAWAWQGGDFLGDVSAILGGSGLGPGAQPKQKPVQNYLLRPIKPIVAFIPGRGGVVDLRVLDTFKPEAAVARLLVLDKARRDGLDFHARFDADSEYKEILIQSNRYDRAKNYLAAAQKHPELMYKFQRDSIWPALNTDLKTTNCESYVKTWYERNKADIVAESVSNGFVSGFVEDFSRSDGDGGFYHKRRNELTGDEIKHLTERFAADAERSKKQWEDYTEREKARLHAGQTKNVEEATREFQATAAGAWATAQQQTLAFQLFCEDLYTATHKPQLPRLRADVYITAVNSNNATSGEDGKQFADQRYKFEITTRLTVNPFYYYGDPDDSNRFTNVICYLKDDDARKAASARATQDIPLLPDAHTALTNVLSRVKPESDKEDLLIVLVSAFSKEMVDPKALPFPRAVEHLPRVTCGTNGYLMAQAVVYGLLPKGPVELKPVPPVLNKSYTKRRGLNQLEGIKITPAQQADAAGWDLLRSTKAQGPWIPVFRDVTDSTKPPVDPEPAVQAGSRTWHYAAIPKTPQQLGCTLNNPDTSQSSAVTLDLSVGKIKFRTALRTEDDLRRDEMSPDERVKADERKAEMQRRWENELATSRARATNDYWRLNLQEKIETHERQLRTAAWLQSKSFQFTWDAPVLGADLQPNENIDVQIFVATAPSGPYCYWDEVPAKRGKATLDFWGNLVIPKLPGRSYYFRARFAVRTANGILFSDWGEATATVPPDHYSGLQMRCYVGPQERWRISCPTVQYKVNSTDYTKFFQPHGPAGMNESAFQAFSAQQRQKITEEFWKDKTPKEGSQNREKFEQKRPKYEQALAEKLQREERDWFDWQKPRALMPTAKLGAVLGMFTPDEPSSANAARPQPQYFFVGDGVEFAAPGWGWLGLVANWCPSNRPPESLEELLVSTEILNGARSADAAPGFGPPQWQRKDNNEGAYSGSRWSLTLPVVGWNPNRYESLEIFQAAQESGPWFRMPKFVFTKNPAEFKANTVDIGLNAVVRTRLCYSGASSRSLRGELWSPPIRLVRPPEVLTFKANGNMANVFGRRGQRLQATLTGRWDPVRFANVSPYGPEGIPEEVYQQKVADLMQAESNLSEKEKASNQPNLLGLTMEQPVGSRETPRGGLNDVYYHLGRKASLRNPNAPAGCLVASFSPGLLPEATWGNPAAFGSFNIFHNVAVNMVVGRTWTFTFPQDGRLSFYANHCYGWTGSHYVQGDGAMTMTFTLNEPAAAAKETNLTDGWEPPPPPKPNWPSLPEQTATPRTNAPPIQPPSVTRPLD